ncbi:LEA type 2 family protein [Marinoscillum furvescens]|uniref:Late embryogenesis abundant protein n=1 Tax=Marinoscillum furvescens DSM 4134 TaxID=1122208 RepID=A0A3D9L172_MARFU|nr:LEA type 2 family protein [Marinoscillum furvescens]RED95568.1 late embryogenesis abundant protein [Marinoscillum furvescens DSM 4134]
MRTILLIAIIGLLAASCSRPDQEPDFRGIRHINVHKVKGTKAELTAEAHFYNPNDVRLKLKNIDVDIMLEGKTIGSIDQDLNMKIEKTSEFVVPLEATFNIGEIGLLNGIISILGGKKVNVTYEGTITASVHGYRTKVPVYYEDEVRL